MVVRDTQTTNAAIIRPAKLPAAILISQRQALSWTRGKSTTRTASANAGMIGRGRWNRQMKVRPFEIQSDRIQEFYTDFFW